MSVISIFQWRISSEFWKRTSSSQLGQSGAAGCAPAGHGFTQPVSRSGDASRSAASAAAVICTRRKLLGLPPTMARALAATADAKVSFSHSSLLAVRHTRRGCTVCDVDRRQGHDLRGRHEHGGIAVTARQQQDVSRQVDHRWWWVRAAQAAERGSGPGVGAIGHVSALERPERDALPCIRGGADVEVARVPGHHAGLAVAARAARRNARNPQPAAVPSEHRAIGVLDVLVLIDDRIAIEVERPAQGVEERLAVGVS